MSSKAIQLLKFKKDLSEIYDCALKAIQGDRLIKNALSLRDNSLILKGTSLRTGESYDVSLDIGDTNIHVIGGGKSVLSMAKGLAELAATNANVSSLFSHGCLSIPEGLRGGSSEFSLESIRTRVCYGSKHNLPDRNSTAASESIIKSVTEACVFDQSRQRRPLFLVLISGGGSACLSSPKLIDLETKLNLINFLVQKGADIVELNKVRRFFSKIKNGQLAAHILNSHPEARIVCLILSDVIGDPIEYIASGPTCLSSTGDQKGLMLEVLRKYNYPDLNYVQNIIEANQIESSIALRSDRDASTAIINRIIGNNSIALNSAKEHAERLGFKVCCFEEILSGSTEKIVKNFTELAGEQFKDLGDGEKLLIIGGGEATVEKKAGESWGKGGRVQEMALDYILAGSRGELSKNLQLSDDSIDLFLGATTDGQDGPTEVAACFASMLDWQINPCFTLDDAIRAKSQHDSYNFWSTNKPENLLKTGLTGTNVMDLYLYMISK